MRSGIPGADAARPSDPRSWPPKALRRRGGGARRGPVRGTGRDRRLPRPQRSRQDDHPRDPRRAPAPRLRRGDGARLRPASVAPGAPRADRDRPRRRRRSSPVLTVSETVELYRAAYPRPALDEVIDARRPRREARRARQLALGGPAARLDVALGIAGDPELLFLDEPTTGFDPSARRRSWELIRRLRSLGKTILLTTHYMEEAQSWPTRVVGHRGRRDRRRLDAGLPLLRRHVGDHLPHLRRAASRYRTDAPQETLLSLLLWAPAARHPARGAHRHPATLEDVYLGLTDGARE